MRLFAIGNELRLLRRHWMSWLFVGALGLLGLLVVAESLSAGSEPLWGEIVIRLVNNLLFFQFPLLAPLAAPILIQQVSVRSDWLWSLPAGSLRILGRQIMALWVLVVIGQLVSLMVASVWLLAVGILPTGALMRFFGVALQLLWPTTLLELGLVVALSLILRQSLVVMGLVLAFGVAFWLGLILPISSLITPLNYTWLDLTYNPLTGFGADTPAVRMLQGLYAVLGVGLIGLALIIAGRTDYRLRPRPLARKALGVATLALLLLGAGSVWGFDTAAADLLPAGLVTPQAWEVRTADHSGSVATDSLEVRAELLLANSGTAPLRSVVLRLNPGLEISRAQSGDLPLAWRREGELLELALPAPVVAQGEVEVLLEYRGRLQFLREDFSPAAVIRGEHPDRYARLVHNFQQAEAVFLGRDGDWRAWPLVAGPQVAPQASITLVAPRQGLLASAEPTGDQLSWTAPIPQVLLVAGPWEATNMEQGSVYLPPHMARGTQAYGERVVSALVGLRNAFPELGLPENPRIVLVPYLRQALFGGDIVLVPLEDPLPYDQLHAQGQRYWELRGISGRLAYDWLAAHTPPTAMLTTTGQIITYSSECGPPDANGQQRCVVTPTERVNPQAPAGRWVEDWPEQPELAAYATVLGQYGALAATGDEAALAAEQRFWLAGDDHASEAAPLPKVTLVPKEPLADNQPPRLEAERDALIAAASSLAACAGPSMLGEKLAAPILPGLESIQGALNDYCP